MRRSGRAGRQRSGRQRRARRMGARLLRREGGGGGGNGRRAAGGPRARAARLVARRLLLVLVRGRASLCCVVRVVGCSLYEYLHSRRGRSMHAGALLINQPAAGPGRERDGGWGRVRALGGPLESCNARGRRRERQRGWRRRWAPLRGSCRQWWSSRRWMGMGMGRLPS